MFEINLTLVIFVVSFLLFMVLLDAWFLKPVGEVMAKRQAKVRDDLSASSEFRADAESRLADYEKRLAVIREEAQKVISDAVTESQSKRNARLTALKDNTRRRLEDERQKLAGERPALVQQLVAHEEELVNKIVEKLLGESRAIEFGPEKVTHALEEAR